MERFTQERVRRQKGGSGSKRYNLADDDDEEEQLTHMGQVRTCIVWYGMVWYKSVLDEYRDPHLLRTQALGEITDDYRPEDDDFSDDELKHDLEQAQFGGFNDDASHPDGEGKKPM